MNLKDAVEMLKKSVDDFERHYENGMKTTDYYLDENTEDEWILQYGSYLEIMEAQKSNPHFTLKEIL